MAEPNRMRLRTMIMVISMVVLPVAAVVGVKVPEFVWSDGAFSSGKSQKPPEKSLADSRSAKPLSSSEDATASKPAGSKNNSAASSPNYPVVRMGNIDVRPEEASFVQPTKGLGFESPDAIMPAVLEEPAASSDVFLQMQQRLRALGATHYSLETWGTTGEAYRFQCRMAAGHDLNYSRHFEATDVDPLRVMHTVLEEVEAWKAGRLP